jgi:hypothetical protein
MQVPLDEERDAVAGSASPVPAGKPALKGKEPSFLGRKRRHPRERPLIAISSSRIRPRSASFSRAAMDAAAREPRVERSMGSFTRRRRLG